MPKTKIDKSEWIKRLRAFANNDYVGSFGDIKKNEFGWPSKWKIGAAPDWVVSDYTKVTKCKVHTKTGAAWTHPVTGQHLVCVCTYHKVCTTFCCSTCMHRL